MMNTKLRNNTTTTTTTTIIQRTTTTTTNTIILCIVGTSAPAPPDTSLKPPRSLQPCSPPHPYYTVQLYCNMHLTCPLASIPHTP